MPLHPLLIDREPWSILERVFVLCTKVELDALRLAVVRARPVSRDLYNFLGRLMGLLCAGVV